MIHYTCPRCRTHLRPQSAVPAHRALRCPKCGERFRGAGAEQPPARGAASHRRWGLLTAAAGVGAILALAVAGGVFAALMNGRHEQPAAGSQPALVIAGGAPAVPSPAAGPPAPAPAAPAPAAAEDKKRAGDRPPGPEPKEAHERPPVPAPAASDEKPAHEPPPAAPPRKPAAAPPPLPHADRKDDLTVLVAGNPPLTQGELDRNLDFWEWVLDLNLTDAQRAAWQKGWADAFQKKKDKAKAQRLSAVKDNVQLWDSVAKMTQMQRDLLRCRIQPGGLAFLRNSKESEHTLLVTLYEQGHKPGGERNAILVASDPPLTRDLMDLYRTAMDYVLDLQMNDRQRDEWQRLYVEDWKKNDPKQQAKAVESWRAPLTRRDYGRRLFRVMERPALLDGLRKGGSDNARWLLAAYEAAHKPGSERNPVLVDGEPLLTRDEAELYCDRVDFALDLSALGGLTPDQRRRLQELLVRDWKGMGAAGKGAFLEELQKRYNKAVFLAQLRSKPDEERSQLLLEVYKEEQDKAARQAARQKEAMAYLQQLQKIVDEERSCVRTTPGHSSYNPTTKRYEWVLDR
jgi:hypothetical protein